MPNSNRTSNKINSFAHKFEKEKFEKQLQQYMSQQQKKTSRKHMEQKNGIMFEKRHRN